MSRSLRHLGRQELETPLRFSVAVRQLRLRCFPVRSARQLWQHRSTRPFPTCLSLLWLVCRATTVGSAVARFHFAPCCQIPVLPPRAALLSLSEREDVFAGVAEDFLDFRSSSAAFTAAACASSISRTLAAERWYERLKLSTCRAKS
jgi:hypothetical protein